MYGQELGMGELANSVGGRSARGQAGGKAGRAARPGRAAYLVLKQRVRQAQGEACGQLRARWHGRVRRDETHGSLVSSDGVRHVRALDAAGVCVACGRSGSSRASTAWPGARPGLELGQACAAWLAGAAGACGRNAWMGAEQVGSSAWGAGLGFVSCG